MTWETLCTITVEQDWQLTPSIAPELGYVRFIFDSSIGSPIWIAQVDPGSPNNIYDEHRITATTNNRVLIFEAPPFFESRALVLRVPNFSPSFNVEIEVSDMPISRAGAAQVTVTLPTSSSTVSSSVNASTDSVQLLAANANRKGFSIVNNSSATLFIDLDAAASSTSYAIALGQGDLYESPINYIGVVSGVWTTVNGNAQIREFI